VLNVYDALPLPVDTLTFVTYLYFTRSIEYLAELPMLQNTRGARGSVVVKALFYKPEGRGFDSR
jgi:hypothetical protein